jgi:hypothetical protein
MVDHSEIKRYQKRMMDACKNLHSMAVPMGNARQLIDFDSDKRKSILAKYMVPFLKTGDSAKAAEAAARASGSYLSEVEDWNKKIEDAYVVRFKWDCENMSFACAQSLLAVEREILHKFPE